MKRATAIALLLVGLPAISPGCGARSSIESETETPSGASACIGPVHLVDAGELPVGQFPIQVAAADLNGDGKLDLAVANAGDGALENGSVSVLLNQGGGTFAPAVDYEMGADIFSVEAVDLNGDGKPDLVAVDDTDFDVRVLMNHGDGTFAPAAQYAIGPAPDSVAVADLNGDGIPDLAVANIDESNLSVLMNQGDGTFAAAVSQDAGGHPHWVAAADLNGDGMPDLAVANPDESNVSVLMNQGDGTFAAAVSYVSGQSPRMVVAADLDGDGMPDLAAANREESSVSVLMNQGDGTFAAAVEYDVGAGLWAIAVGDLDGDGRPDLAVTSRTSADPGSKDRVYVLLNQGKGTFVKTAEHEVGSFAAVLAVADLDGDGRPDVAIPHLYSGSVSLLFNPCLE